MVKTFPGQRIKGGVTPKSQNGKKKRRVLKKYSLIVIRITSGENLGNSRPCNRCLAMAKSLGIRYIYYSTGIGPEIKREKVKDMISINDSNAARKVVNLYNDIKMNYNDYFLNLMRRNFPNSIKEYNLLAFITYNLRLIFPNIEIVKKGTILTIKIILKEGIYSFNTRVIQ